MRRAALGVAAAIAACSIVDSPGAHAESGTALVAILTAEPSSSLTRRVQAELRSLGVDVIVLKPPDEGSPSRAPLEQAARSVGAVAAVRLVASREGRVEVWVADRVTGKAVVRELDAPGSGASDAAVAVGTVELFRASLMELHSGEPLRGDAAASEAIRSLALPATSGPRVPRLGLGVGAGVELGIRGLGPSADADLGVWARVASRFGVRLVGHSALSGAHVATASGSVDVRSQLVGAMGTFDFADPSSTWTPRVALGIGAAHVTTTGAASPPFVGVPEEAWAAAPLAGVGMGWSFVPGLRLRGDGLAALALPPVHVSTPTKDVGWWGAPALILSLGIEVLWSP